MPQIKELVYYDSLDDIPEGQLCVGVLRQESGKNVVCKSSCSILLSGTAMVYALRKRSGCEIIAKSKEKSTEKTE